VVAQSVGIVRLRTQAMEFSFFLVFLVTSVYPVTGYCVSLILVNQSICFHSLPVYFYLFLRRDLFLYYFSLCPEMSSESHKINKINTKVKSKSKAIPVSGREGP
jgi:hypothetical protein